MPAIVSFLLELVVGLIVGAVCVALWTVIQKIRGK
jgi:predicted DNA repair protein MutK